MNTIQLSDHEYQVNAPTLAAMCVWNSRPFRTRHFITVQNTISALVSLLCLLLPHLAGAESHDELETSFRSPPAAARPWLYWFALSGNLTSNGITADLEAMARVGIGGVLFMEAERGAPPGPAAFGGPLWRNLFKHICGEAHRLGLQVNMNNDAGWCGSGGPWITPELSMQKLVWTEVMTNGGTHLDTILPQPKSARDFYRDIAVLAFPTSAGEEVSMGQHSPMITSSDPGADPRMLIDRKPKTTITLPKPSPENPSFVRIDFPERFATPVLSLTTGASVRRCFQGELHISDNLKDFRKVCDFDARPGVTTVSFPEVSARAFKIVFTRVDPNLKELTLAEVDLSPHFRLNGIQGKAVFANQEFVPQATYPTVPPGMTIARERLVDLTSQLQPTGRLVWDMPAGHWTILRLGHTSTGIENHPAPIGGLGLECDKLSKNGARAMFDGLMAKLIADSKPLVPGTLVSTHIDSWEVGCQNWTADFRQEFQRRRGYDLFPYLPVVTGRVVGNVEFSERFLWDFRQTISDLLVDNYAGEFQSLAGQHGMRLSIEAYGAPAQNLVYASRADEPMAELWSSHPYYAAASCTEMASAAHVYGKRIVALEAFTADSAERWLKHPFSVKEYGDWAFCEGINRLVIHRYALQPWTNPDRVPGMAMGRNGLRYERTQTWWEQSKAWHEYVARCQHMLRQGLFVADICYLAPEMAPQRWEAPMSSRERPRYNFDACPAEALMTMEIRNGRLALPNGMSYRILVLPQVDTMTPRLLRKIQHLAKDGAAIIGPPPMRSPSLSDYPGCDVEVRQITRELWDTSGSTGPGLGRVYWGETFTPRMDPQLRGKTDRGAVTYPDYQALAATLARLGVPPDFESDAKLRYTHRRDESTDIYFLASNQTNWITANCTFRVSRKQPELWNPVTGEVRKIALFHQSDGRTILPVTLEPVGSVFVVFREPVEASAGIATFTRNGENLLPQPGATSTTPPAAELLFDKDSRLRLLAWQPGRYVLQTASGSRRSVEISACPPAVTVEGAWEVNFQRNRGAPERLSFDALVDWSRHPDTGVKYFSGTAEYHKTITLSRELLKGPQRLFLDLGNVFVMADVKVNGKIFGTLWKPPFRVDVTDALMSGSNSLEIKVSNLLVNRQIGDEQLPEDSDRNVDGTVKQWPQWLQDGLPSPTGRYTFTSWRQWTNGSPLQVSGLLGPVKILPAAERNF
ncbi:MAG: glycosyl hydrolase [Verrucomicrobiota bacterium]